MEYQFVRAGFYKSPNGSKVAVIDFTVNKLPRYYKAFNTSQSPNEVRRLLESAINPTTLPNIGESGNLTDYGWIQM